MLRQMQNPFAIALTVVFIVALPRPSRAQDAIRPEALRKRLFALAADSMMGRDPGTRASVQATDYVAAEFKRLGLKPMGEGDSFFQTVPLGRVAPDKDGWLSVGNRRLVLATEFLPLGRVLVSRDLRAVPVIYGGLLNDQTTWITAEQARGRVVVLGLAEGARPFGSGAAQAYPGFHDAIAVAPAILDRWPAATLAQVRRGGVSVGAPAADTTGGPVLLIVSTSAAELLLGQPLTGRRPGEAGGEVSGHVGLQYQPFTLPARNVIAVLPGRDPKLRAQYVSITAHNDHVGLLDAPVDHDSIRAYNRVVRPMGADSPERPATAEEATRIGVIRDSLRAIRPPRADSVLNGADDDGTGTVALLEIAGALSRLKERPRRSILFVSHTAEELGLLGSRWFTDHLTVSRDSIVGEIDMDMIGRGDADDLPAGGLGYLEVIGSRRLSTEFGDTLEAVNRRQPQPFSFNYEYDAPGHPLQYYCRADHYSYARYGIPATALSRGEHLDYHQVTDEPQYIDYDALARVARMVRDAAMAIGNMSHRPALNGPKGDPTARCVQ
ncbi:MAG: M28 family peptidase [Gemmatimonadales bacterium]